MRNPKSSNAGKLLRYMATRESVEKVAVGIDRSPSTVRQQRLIKNILDTFPETKDYLEYEDYLKESSKTNATEFIEAVIERNIDRLDAVKNLVKYYGERPALRSSAHTVYFLRSMIRLTSKKLPRKFQITRESSGLTL